MKLIVLLLLVALQCRAQDLSIGTDHTIKSTILNEERKITISLPLGYEESERRYPVLYILGAEMEPALTNVIGTVQLRSSLNESPPMLIVGIHTNQNYSRDLFPVPIEGWGPQSGQASNFLTFIADELIPYIESEFRVIDYKILFGQSNAGLFAIYSLATKQEIFDGYLINSPMIGWCPEYIDSKVEELKDRGDVNSKLWLSFGEYDYPEVLENIHQIEESLTVIEGLHLKIREYSNKGHTPIPSVYDGLDWIFNNWYYSINTFDSTGVEGIKDHYSSLASSFDSSVKPPPNLLFDIGIPLLRNQAYGKALSVFDLLLEFYPDSFSGYYFKGLAHEGLGEREEAIMALESSLRIKPDYTLAQQKLKALHE